MPSITVHAHGESIMAYYRVNVSRSFKPVDVAPLLALPAVPTTTPLRGRPTTPSALRTGQSAQSGNGPTGAVIPAPAPGAGKKATLVETPPDSTPTVTKLYGIVRRVTVTVVGTQDLETRKEGVSPYVTLLTMMLITDCL